MTPAVALAGPQESFALVDPFNVALDEPSIIVGPGCPPRTVGVTVNRDPGFTTPLAYSVTFTGPVSPLPTLRPEVAIQDAATDAPRLVDGRRHRPARAARALG